MAQSRLRTLLIEPEPLMADVTSFRLELLDYQVTIATTPAEVWQAIDRTVPHAVLLNLDSEDLDGFGLLDKFASDIKTSEIPILALSSDADLDRVERAWKAGVRDYLLTPYDPLALERKLARMLDGVVPEAEQSVAARPEAARAEPGEVGPDDELILAAVAQSVPTIEAETADTASEFAATENAAATDLNWHI